MFLSSPNIYCSGKPLESFLKVANKSTRLCAKDNTSEYCRVGEEFQRIATFLEPNLR